MKRYKIHIENYATIDEMELDLDPGVQGFVGENAQGKTNILKAIQDILDGKSDPSKIRDGEKRYVLRLDVLGEDGKLEASISRIQTPNGTRLEAKGLPIGHTASTYLSKLLDSRMLNPIRLITESPVEYLKQHLPAEILPADLPEGFDKLGIDIDRSMNGFKFCEKVAEYISVLRKEDRKNLKTLDGVIEDLATGLPEKLPECPADLQEVQNGLAEIDRQLHSIQGLTIEASKQASQVSHWEHVVEETDRMISETLHKIEQLKTNLGTLQQLKSERQGMLADARERADQIVVPDKSKLISMRDFLNGKIREVQSWESTKARYDKRLERGFQRQALTEAFEIKDRLYKHFAHDLPKKIIERASLPVEGIEFRESELYVNDRRVDLLSETERAIVATKLAVALAKLKGHVAISLDGVEIMDDAHRKEWLDVASNSGIKVFYTRQGSPEGSHEFKVVQGRVAQ